MEPLIKTTLTSAAALMLLPVLSFAEGKSIYGNDNRIDFYNASHETRTLSDSVVSLWSSDMVEAAGPGLLKLDTDNFGERLRLCKGERFAEQPTGAFCSGALVGKDLIITAAHCVKDEAECKDTRFVFGYAVKKPGAPAVTEISDADVYSCAKVVKRFLGGEPGSENPAGQSIGPDYALIQLDRIVTGHEPLAINRGRDLKKGDRIFVIGHPSGLPLKIAGDAKVRNFSKIGYFTASLDTFSGNSGSPVFNTRTNLLEGVLVRGAEDYAQSPSGCTRAAVYPQTGGRGEDVTKVSAFASFIPGLPGEEAEGTGPEETIGVNIDPLAAQSTGAMPSKTISFD